jgi:hypothetical protein
MLIADRCMAPATRDVEATLRLFRALGDERRLRLIETGSPFISRT